MKIKRPGALKIFYIDTGTYRNRRSMTFPLPLAQGWFKRIIMSFFILQRRKTPPLCGGDIRRILNMLSILRISI